MEALNFTCPKCKNTQYEADEFRATGGFLSKVFNVQSKRISTVTCTQCKSTEIFKADSSTLDDIFDFFTD